jgi:hypothetical protein
MRLLAAALTVALIAGCDDRHATVTTLATPTPIPTFACDPNVSAEPAVLTRASGTIQTNSPGRERGTFTRFANSTFFARFEVACPSGAQGEWTDARNTWVVSVLIGKHRDGTFALESGSIIVEYYGEDPPLFADASRCEITYPEFSPAGILGHAECHGLRWYNDYEAQTDPDSAEPIAGLEPFDLNLSFEGGP